MRRINLGTELATVGSDVRAPQINFNPLLRHPARLRLRRLRVLLISVCAGAATACASLSAPSTPDDAAAMETKAAAMQAEVSAAQAETSAAQAEAEQARADSQAAAAALAEAEAKAAAMQAETNAAQAEAEQARADSQAAAAALAEAEADAASSQAAAAAAVSEAQAAMRDAAQARAAAADAQADSDAMMMAKEVSPAAVMVAADQLDISLLSLDDAQASLAGPDSVYISSIRYGGDTYSVLLKYAGGTTATVEQIFGSNGKLIPDSVGLGQTELALVAPDTLTISNVEVGGIGYSGELQYVGGSKLQVTGLRRVTLPATAAEQLAALQAEMAAMQAAADAAIAQAQADAAAAQAAADAALSEAMADADAAMAAADKAMAAADASAADAAAAQADVDAMMAAAHQPSEMMVSAAMLDPSLASLDSAQVSLAGPDSIYVSSIMYDGQSYSALLKYSGGTSATVEAVYGPMGKLIPDSVGLSQTALTFVAPDSLDVSNVQVGGMGYSGTLQYAGGNQLQVTGIRQVTLPPTAAEEAAAAAVAQAEADAAAAVSAAQAAADAAVSDAQAAADMAVSAAQAAAGAAMADADAAMAAASAAEADAAGAQAEVDAMMAAAHQPSEVMVSAAMLDPSLANLDGAQVSLAGPDMIYVSSIMYDGQSYSALLKYSGGTTATVEAVYGPMGKLIPDSVGLAQAGLAFVAPDSLDVSNVQVGGMGYSGTLQYAGGNQLQVTGIRQVALPPTDAEVSQAENESLKATIAAQLEQIAALEAALEAAEAATSDATAATAAAQAAADAAMADADAAMAAASAAEADAAAAQTEVDAMMAAAHQPSEVMVSAAMLDPSMASLDNAQVSLAGPDSIYVSSIMYDGQSYSALLKYSGGTTATVEAVYGPMGKLIPDSVGLSQAALTFVAPDSLDVSNVQVGGMGYSGTLQYAGGNQLQVTGIRQVTLPPTAAEEAAAAVAQAEADAAAAVSAAQADAGAAMADAAAAQAAADAAMADADAAMAAVSAAEADAAAAQAEVDAMMAAAHQPSEVMVSAAMLDPSMASLDNAQVSLAGPDSIYVSSIMYDGQSYSALLRYSGGTTATVEAVYGPMGKLIPDSVGLSQAALTFVAPDSLDVSNVQVGGMGYSGTLQYAGGNQLQVTGIRQVTLPPTAAEEAAAAQAAAAAAVAQAEADAAAAVSAAQAAADGATADAAAAQAAADAAMADADAAMAAADASAADAAAAQAEVDAMMAAAHQPSEVMVSAAMLDPSMANLDNAQVSLAGPDSIYVSSIMYDGQSYSALLKYSGGTTATVEAVYGPMGKLIPDSVGLSQAALTFVAPDSLDVSNVQVGGMGYSGTLQYAGGNQLQVTGIRQVTLPPTAAEEAAAAVAQAEADAAAAVSAAQAAADGAMADAAAAQAAADAAMADADAATADAGAAMAAADASAADATAAQAEVDAMMAAAHQPSEVMVSAAMLDPSMANLDNAQVSLAGPDSIYVSSIMYDGQSYSALLKYSGGTTATVEAVYGPMGKLIPDSVGLSQTGLTFMAPDSLDVSNVQVGGMGYSGTLQYAGGNQLQVTGIRQVTLPSTAAEEAAAAVAQAEADAAAAVSAAQAAADGAMADAEAAQAAADAAMADADAATADADAAMAAADASAADAAAAQAEVDAMMAAAHQPSEVMVSAAMLDPSMASLDNAQVSLAGPDSIYVSSIMYDGQSYSALLKYSGGTTATVEAVYGPMGKLIPDSVGLSQTGLTFMAPDSLDVSNVQVGGMGYSGTLQYAGGNQLQVTGIRQVTLPPTAAEEAAAAVAQAEADAAAAVSAAQAAADAAVSDAQAAADMAVSAAQAAADAAVSDAQAASDAAISAAMDEAAAAQADVDAMMAAAHQPSEVMVSAAMLDPSMANLDNAQVSLAGPDSIYVSSIMYDGQSYSALLKYSGGTTATVEAVYGPMGKLIPDSVGLSQAALTFVAPDSLDVSNVQVGGMGYSGTLQYAGGNQLQVTGIRQVTLPPTAAEEAAAAVAQAEADAAAAVSAAQAAADGAMADAAAAQAAADAAMADADAATADAGAAMAAADASAADATAAQAEVDAMMAAAHQPSEVMVSAAMLDPSMASLDNAQVSLAGPDSIYVSSIMYDGQSYSALLKYSGGTTATVEAVYGPMGKLIPDSVGLSQAALTFVAPDSLDVSNVQVGGMGYSGTLQYAGGNQLQVTGIRQVTLPPTAAEEAAAAVAQAEADAAAAVSAAQAAADGAMADAAAAQAAADAAMADADAATADAGAAMAAADASAADATAAQAEVDAMMAAAHQPSEVMVSAAMLDPSLASLDNAQVSLAGPDSIYVSSIMYDGQSYSALLKYSGGTTATVEAVYGPMGKLIPDSVGLSQTALTFMAPDSLDVSNVQVGGMGYSGTLQYAGGNQLQVTGIRQVTLPPTAAEEAAAAVAQAEADAAAAVSAAQAAADGAMADAEAAQAAADAAMADADAATADAGAAMAAADASAADATAAQAEVDAMMAAAHQPSEVMVSAAMLDPSMASLDNAQVSLAGPDSIYVSSIMYDGQSYSALLKYSGGTTATVEAVYGPMGKLIPDSVGLSQTALTFMAPDSLDVSNVQVGGMGYSGTLQYAGGNQLQVTGIRQVTLPPTAAEEAAAAAAAAVAQTEADAAAAVSAAQEAADGAMADAEAAQAAADAAMADADAATADADAAMAAADASAADATAAQAEVDAMMAAAHQPSEVMVSAAMLDPSMASLDNAQVSLAGPDSIYVSSIMYDGQSYSALLKYSGGTTATVEAVYGPMGKLIPDSVGLSQTALTFVAPDSLDVSNVQVGGMGYSGTLQYAGGNQLQVTGIRPVTLPSTAAEEAAAAQAAAAAAVAQAEADAAAAVSAAQEAADGAMADAAAAQAAADAAMADADAATADAGAAMAAADASAADATAAQAEVDAMMAAAHQPSEVMVSAAMLDPSMANLDNAQVSLAGPDSIYVSSIMYDGQSYSALLKYSGGTTATVEAVYGPMGKLIPDSVGLSQTGLTFVAPDSLDVSNVQVGGMGYSGTLQYAGGNQLQVTGIRQVTLPPTATEEAAAAQAAAAAAVAQAEADAAAAVSAAQAAADGAMADAAAAQAAADAAMADADAATADADAAMAAADASAADATAAQAEVDAMMAAAHQPSEVMVSAAMLDPSMASLDNAQVSLAGPDSIYVSSIMYDGQSYSALLKYSGGTTATVEAVYGPMGKLIPDSVGLSQTGLTFMAPDSLDVSNVQVGGMGYSGTLQYAGGNQLQVTGIRQVTLPPTAAEEAAAAQAAAAAAVAQAEADAAAAVSAAQAATDGAMAEAAAAQAAADAAMADADAAMAAADASAADAAAAQAAAAAAESRVAQLMGGVAIPTVDPSLLSLASARLTVAGLNAIYVSGIQYGGKEYSARLRYEQGTGIAESLFDSSNNLISDTVAMDAADVELVGDALIMSNIGIDGRAHTFTLRLNSSGGIDVSMRDDRRPVRTAAELRRDKLITAGSLLVNGFDGGMALSGEGSWTSSGGSMIQDAADASHAKYAISASQSGSETLYGITASANGDDKVGFGLHFLASEAPDSGNTWNYGRSYLVWVTQDPFYGTEDTHLQFYESHDNNTLTWLASSSIAASLSSQLTLEALYHDSGMVTLLVGGEEQLTVNVAPALTGGDGIALRALGGPVTFSQVYVYTR